MKHLVTMTACLMILMALLSQLVQNQKILFQLEEGRYVVDIFCDNGDEEALKSSLHRILHCDEDEIMIEKNNENVTIKVPIHDVLATPGFWGVTREMNQGSYCWERKIKDG